MSKRVGIFMDVANLYGTIGARYGSRKLDYKAYYTYASDFGDVVMSNAYGSQMKDEATGFINCLRDIGFSPIYKKIKCYHNDDHIKHKADWDVGIAIDIVKAIANLDMVILGSADGDFQSLTKWILEQGKQVLILACGISKDLRETCTEAIEIPESMLEGKNEKNKMEQTDRNSNSGDPDNGSHNKHMSGQLGGSSTVCSNGEPTEGQRITGENNIENTKHSGNGDQV
jgi:uncharacterized LabA/DUF88 family protein